MTKTTFAYVRIVPILVVFPDDETLKVIACGIPTGVHQKCHDKN